jgi:UDP-glucose-4-epimerase GalE
MATILVTGGAGYIGSHACKALAAAGHVPVVYDNLENGHEWAVQWGPFERGDIRERERLDAAIAAHRPDAVMHFAGYIEVGESVRDPLRFYRNNVAGSLVLLEAMHAADIGHIVFSSTCAVYGQPEVVPIGEETGFAPISPYARSKLAVEYMLEDCRTAHGLNYAALRYFNAAGADPAGRIGESHSPETHAIPLLIETALGRREKFSIFGTDYPTADGTAVRDYIHVDDLAAAHVSALELLLGKGGELVLNLGTGSGCSVRELIDSVARVSGRELPIVEEGRRPGDPPALVANPARAREVLSWQPAYTEIDDIVATAWKWHAEKN